MKNLFALFCTLCCFIVPSTVSAEGTAPPLAVVYMDEQLALELSAIEPRFSYLVSAGTDVKIVDGQAQCQGNYTTAGTRRIRITMTLQYSSVNTDLDAYWSDVETWVKSWRTSGVHVLEKRYDLTKRGYYRVHTDVSVLDDNDIILEGVVLISLVRQY